MVLQRAVSNLGFKFLNRHHPTQSKDLPPTKQQIPSVPSTNPKTLKGDVIRHRTSLESSRRRRARATGGPYAPRHAVENAQKKRVAMPAPVIPKSKPAPPQSADVEMGDVNSVILDPPVPTRAPKTPKLPTIPTINLPRALPKPTVRPINPDSLAAVSLDLAGTDPAYIRDALRTLGAGMLKVLASVRASPPPGALPKTMPVIISDLSSDGPTHMLAVYGRADSLPPQPSSSSSPPRTKVVLFPAHDLVLAANCAHLPPLPPISESPEIVDGTTSLTLDLPVVPLCLPHPPSFPALAAYLYTSHPGTLASSLLPGPPPPTSSPPSEFSAGPSTTTATAEAAIKLAQTYTLPALLQSATRVHGAWKNACALGICDESLWKVLDRTWGVIVEACSISARNASSR